MSLPAGVACDTQTGSIYFAERRGNTVRRLTTSGFLETVAGSGVQGFSGDGGRAIDAALDSPSAVAFDIAGDLLIADSGNHRIRRVSTVSGVITTVAGTGAPGFAGDDGPAAQAKLSRPVALAVNKAGDIAISDAGNSRVRRVDEHTGVISTMAGSGNEGFAGDGGAAIAASLDEPAGIAFSSAGDLFIADSKNGRVRLVDGAQGTIHTVAGGPNSLLQGPRALAVDAKGDLVVADSATHRILHIALPAGSVTVVAGTGGQAFAGDGGASVTAMLDSPAGLAVAQDGSVIVADSGNDRLRSISAPSLGLSQIHTIAGADAVRDLSIVLSGAAISTYGSGTLVASVTGSAGASGSLTLIDVADGSSTPVATAQLSGGIASFSAGMLSAGVHHLIASLAGNEAHASVTSGVWTLTVQQLTMTATPLPVNTVFGAPLPPLTGSLSGVLDQDRDRVSSLFVTAATANSPPGAYPIAVSLTGTAAPNYLVQAAPASVTISRAPSLAILVVDAPAGAPQTVSLHVRSSTTGLPTGAATLLDGAGIIAAGVLDATGTWTVPIAQLAAGPHQLTGVYGGDADLLSSQTPALSFSPGNASPVSGEPDFALQPATAAPLSIVAGDTASIAFTVTTVHGTLAGPIALSASGLPPFATGNFDPPSIPPGGAVSSFKLSILTAPTAINKGPRQPLTTLLCLLVVPIALLRTRGLDRRFFLASLLFLGTLLPLAGCGDRVSIAAGPGSAAAPVVYRITVTGTATQSDGTLLQRTVTVNLSVSP